jgi:succinoglycan biosynthesis transport protein ExoP
MLSPLDNSELGRQQDGAIGHGRDGEAVNFSEIIAIVRRQYRVVVVGIILGCVFGGAYLVTAAPKYTATTALLIDSKKGSESVMSNGAIADLTIDSSAIDSQVEILRSEKIANAVIEDLRLIPSAEQGLKPYNPTFLDQLRNIFSLSWWVGSDEKTEQEQQRIATAAQLSYLQRNLAIRRVGRTYVLEIGFTDTNPSKAAEISGSFAKAYLDDQFDANYEITRRASSWLLSRIQELKQKSLETDLAVQKFRAEKGLITAKDGVTVNDQQLTEVNSQLIIARGDVAQAKAKFERIQAIIKSGQTDAAVSEAISNPIIVELRNKYLSALKLEQDISKRIGPNHEQAVKLRGELKEYEKLIFDELGRIAESYKSELDIATARETSLEQSLKTQVGVNGVDNEELVSLRELEREADTYKNLYQTLLQRYQETVQKQSFPISEARVITVATPPLSPSAPQKPLIMALSAVLGMIFGGGVAAFREFRDRGFRTSKQIRDYLGLEFLGMLPLISQRQLAKISTVQIDRNGPVAPAMISAPPIMRYSISSPLSNFAETLRGTKVAIDITLGEKKSKIIGFISVLPNEGKSTVAKNFASLLAHLGQRTLLIDGDLRNPGMTRLIAPRSQSGLLEILMDGRNFRETIMNERESDLSLIPAVIKDRVTHTSELLASSAMRKLLDDVSPSYQYIVVDLPPLGPAVDARAAAKFFDCFVFIAEWGRTSRDVIVNTLQNDPVIAEKCVGVILNKVDFEALKTYDNDGSKEYYYSSYGKYYGRTALGSKHLQKSK